MKTKIIYLVVISALALSYFAVRMLFHDERGSSLKRVAYCQFLRVGDQLANDPKFWSNSYDIELWHSLIDLEKASCNSELVVVGSRLFDFTGAEILLSTSPDGTKYLNRVKGLDKKFVPLPPGFDKYEFPSR